MSEEKADWEVWLDDSYQWHIGHRVCFALVWTCAALSVFVNIWWLLSEFVFLALWFGFKAREGYMVDKAVQLRKEQEDGD